MELAGKRLEIKEPKDIARLGKDSWLGSEVDRALFYSNDKLQPVLLQAEPRMAPERAVG